MAGRRIASLLTALFVAVSGLAISPRAVAAAEASVLRSFTADLGSCGVATGLAFDGTNIISSCWSDHQLRAVSPVDGRRVVTYNVTGVVGAGLGALSWDRGREALWACGLDNWVYLIELDSDPVPVVVVNRSARAARLFPSEGCVDGLAYDGSDDTLFTSGDASPNLVRYSSAGVRLNAFNLAGRIGGCGNSGIAVGGDDLFLANNGCSEIYRADKGLRTITRFATYPQRLEDLECDDVTFRGQGAAAVWNKDAYDNVLTAFKIDQGTCGYGGYPVGHGTKLLYVALGDSYSSGEGTFDFENGSNYPGRPGGQENTLTSGLDPRGNNCHRSMANYAKVNVNPFTGENKLEPGLASTLLDVTCSGALITQEGDPHGVIIAKDLKPAPLQRFESQVEFALNSKRLVAPAKPVDLVTVSMGGNDAGFGDLILACILPNILRQAVAKIPAAPGAFEWLAQNLRCSNLQGLAGAFGSNVDDKIAARGSAERLGHDILLQQFPQARVLQLTYPLPLPRDGVRFGESCGGIAADDVAFARLKGSKINSAIRKSVADTRKKPGGDRLELVDVQESFGSNGLCPSGRGQYQLANGLTRTGINRAVDYLLDPAEPIRAEIDKFISTWRTYTDCLGAQSDPGHAFNFIVCQLKLGDVKDAAKNLGKILGKNGRTIPTMLVKDVEGKTPDQLFDESRNFFHPTKAGFEVMACGVRAEYKHQDINLCNPATAKTTFTLNGGPITTRKPIRVVPRSSVPFRLDGFTPGSAVYVVLRSDPVSFGPYTADDNGGIAGVIDLPGGLQSGVHQLEFFGDADGLERTIEAYLQLDGPTLPGKPYSAYLDGFTPGEDVTVDYSGLPLGTFGR
jgi:hypothetical protein